MRTLLLFVLALGCATATSRAPTADPAPQRPLTATTSTSPRSLDLMLRGDMAGDHAFPWSAARALTWRDFQGTPPTDGSEGAMTSYALYSGWRCRGDAFEFRVIAGFRPRESWVKPLVLNDTAQRRTVLGHEQTHFDLAEVHARRMRQAFASLTRPCAKPDEELGALVRRLTQEERAEQRRYDAETDHGLRASRQAAWTVQTRRRLAASN